MSKLTLKTTAKPLACLLTLQPGKTYVTNSGEHITLSEYSEEGNYHCFIGSNGFYYGADGFIFEGEYGNPEDISHELQVEQPEVQLIESFKFKQKDNGVKRTIKFNDYSDSTVQIEFKTKTKGQEVLIGGIRLSYEALDMLYDCLCELHEQGEDRVYH